MFQSSLPMACTTGDFGLKIQEQMNERARALFTCLRAGTCVLEHSRVSGCTNIAEAGGSGGGRERREAVDDDDVNVEVTILYDNQKDHSKCYSYISRRN